MSNDTSFLERLRIGQRFESDGHKGTVLFVGRLEKSKNPLLVYAGVAWDDSTRGKHDGQHEGTRYFTCAPGCGSFVNPEKLNFGVSFMAAVRDRYCSAVTEAESAERYLVAQNRPDRPAFAVPVVFVGQDKAQRKVSDLAKLPRVSLSDMLVNGAGNADEQAELAQSFPELRELGISGNLLSNWSDVNSIIRHMPNLEELRANHSVFTDEHIHSSTTDELALADFQDRASQLPWVIELKPSLVKLKTLYLHQTKHAFDFVWTLALAGALPSLTFLSLANLGLRQLPPTVSPQVAAQLFPCLEHFDISENPIDDFGEIARFASELPSLKELVLNHTLISVVEFTNSNLSAASVCANNNPNEDEKVDPSQTSLFANVRFASLNNCRVAEFAGLAGLSSFPKLVDLRFQRNPLSEALGQVNARQGVVALLPALKVLNQSEIRPRERIDADKYFIKPELEMLLAAPASTASSSSSSTSAVDVIDPTTSLPESAKEAAASIAAKLASSSESSSSSMHSTYTGPCAEVAERIQASLHCGRDHIRRRFQQLIQIYGVPEKSKAEASGPATLASNMLDITFRSMDPNSITTPATTKKVPMSMTISQVKAFLSRIFKLPAAEMKLNYRIPGADWPETIGEQDDMRPLEYFGLRSGSEILMELKNLKPALQ